MVIKGKTIKIAVLCFLSLMLAVALCVLSINTAVKLSSKDRILSADDDRLVGYDCILVLGAGVRNGAPSDMLEDRLLVAIELYKSGEVASKLLMSGDHGKADYDEVNVMKRFAIEQGVPSEDIFMDHAGFSTYESIYRAKHIFGAKKIIIVTQEYHLYRALYVAQRLGLEAYGVSSDIREYVGKTARDTREILARNKDFFMCIFKPKPTYLGDMISLKDNGNITDG
jgi:vancomycin permeability regulator SanA